LKAIPLTPWWGARPTAAKPARDAGTPQPLLRERSVGSAPTRAAIRRDQGRARPSMTYSVANHDAPLIGERAARREQPTTARPRGERRDEGRARAAMSYGATWDEHDERGARVTAPLEPHALRRCAAYRRTRRNARAPRDGRWRLLSRPPISGPFAAPDLVTQIGVPDREWLYDCSGATRLGGVHVVGSDLRYSVNLPPWFAY